MGAQLAAPAAFHGSFFAFCRLTAALNLPFGAVFFVAMKGLTADGPKLTGRSGAIAILAPLCLSVGALSGIVGLVGYLFGK